jgi:hypothetical protein
MYVTFNDVIGYQSGNFTNGYLPGFGVREIQLNGSTNDLRNQKFNVTGFMIGRSSDAPASRITLQVESVSTPSVPTDAEILALATQRYVAPVANAELTTNLTLPTTYTPTGTTFVANLAWTSSNPSVISNTGVVTRPASGQPDASVTMSYVMSVGAEANAAVEIAYTVKAAEAVAIQTLFTNDFGAVAKTGYAAGNIIYTPTGGTEITAAKDRVQINISATAPHTSMGAFAVFAPISTTSTSYMDINFSAYTGAGKLEFDYSVWSTTAYSNLINTAIVSTASLKLQKFDGSAWVDLGDPLNIITNVSATEYKKSSFTLTGAAQYRLVYAISGPALTTSNTAFALTVDNLVVTDR